MVYLKKEVLNKLSKKGRERIIELEAKLKKIELEKKELDLIETKWDNDEPLI